MTAESQGSRARSIWGALGADFGTRLASALVLFGIGLVVIYVGGWVFAAFMAAVCIRMAFEWERLTQEPMSGWTFAIAAVGIAGAIGLSTAGQWYAAAVALGAATALCGIIAIALKRHAGWAAALVPYLGAPAMALVWLRGGEEGFLVTLWFLFVVWATDSWAMIAGRVIGGPKLIPALSPKKTWAGLAGGVLGALGIGYLFSAVAGEGTPAVLAPLIVTIAIVGQIGDVLESAIKRRFHKKDAGSLIPGHGGFLDRMDSVLAATLVFALTVWLIPGLPFGR